MKITERLLCVAGAAIIISTATGFAASNEKYFLHHPKAKKQEITAAMYKGYLRGDSQSRVGAEEVFNLQAALVAGALIIGAGLIFVSAVKMPTGLGKSPGNNDAPTSDGPDNVNQPTLLSILDNPLTAATTEGGAQPTPQQLRFMREFSKLVEEAKDRTRQQQAR